MPYVISVGGVTVYEGDAANLLDAFGKAAEARKRHVERAIRDAVERRHYWPHDRRAYDESTGEPFTKADAIAQARYFAESEWDYQHGLLDLNDPGAFTDAEDAGK